MKKRVLAVLLTAMLTACVAPGAMAGQTALEAFGSLMAPGNTAAPQERTAREYLDAILAGDFAQAPAGAAEAEAFAAHLGPLCAITNRDIAAYASERGLKAAQVRSAFFKALAQVLKAEIAVHPAAEEKYRNVQMILSLFLEPGEEAAKAEIRAQMSPESSRRIAQEYDLPEKFVEFVIMDAAWNDDSWENDEDWRAQSAWAPAQEEFADVHIGGRDTGGSTKIADMQAALIRLGYLRGKADGVFGPRTQSALLEFQLANGLAATGVYTAALRDALDDADIVARWDYDDDFWDSDDPDRYDTPDRNTPDRYDTPSRYNTPDYYTPDYNTPDYHTPDYNTPDYNTPDYNTPDYNTPDYNTPDYNTPDYNTPDRHDTPDRYD